MRKSELEHVGRILPRVLEHLWNATTFEAGWEGRELRRLALPPPHPEKVA